MTVDWQSFTDRTVETAEVRLLGVADIPSVLALQKLLVHEVRQQNRMCAAVMICEHPPAITAGQDSSVLDLPVDHRELESRLLKVHRVPRDGGTIFHQPGQLAIYTVVSLVESGLTPLLFRSRLSEAIVRSCKDVQVRVAARPDDPSTLWGRQGLVCQLGIGMQQGVTCFGAWLNVSCRIDEASLYGRGLRGARISSLNTERVRPTLMGQIRSSVIAHVCEQLGFPEYHIHTGHPFLKRALHSQSSNSRRA